ncbi:MAG: radical SAM protein [bacterium]
MNILLTNRCNRRCSYCFAQERISFGKEEGQQHAAPELISEENFRTALAFAQKSKIPMIGLLGGEPSLHPQFIQFLELVRDAELTAKVFTNGLWKQEQIDAVAELFDPAQERINLVVNVNGPQRTPADHQRRQEHLLSRLGRRCSLSFNISRVDFDPGFLVDLITRYRTKGNIRLGVAQPLADMKNEHIDIADYREMVPTLMKLAQACDENDISLGFDCGFLLCMFTPEEHGRLFYSGARFKATCGPAIDVGTDLSTWSCFPLSTFSQGARLTDFEHLDEVANYFKKKFKPLFQAGALPDCRACRHRKRNQCPGGCAAHVYRRLNP